MSADKKKIKLVHTSDVHLGGDAGHPLADVAFRAVVDAVFELNGDALLLAGDIFDNGRVGNDVVDFFLNQVSRLTAPVVALPGNHDLYSDDSIYRRQQFCHKPDNLYIFTQPEGQTISFPELTLDLWGRAMLCHEPGFCPLAGMPSASSGRWLVAMAHGHFHYDEDRDLRSSPIYPEEVARASCDYLALGHWDRHVDVSQGMVKAAYSGTPRGPSRHEPVSAVTTVDLDPRTGVHLSRASLNGVPK